MQAAGADLAAAGQAAPVVVRHVAIERADYDRLGGMLCLAVSSGSRRT